MKSLLNANDPLLRLFSPESIRKVRELLEEIEREEKYGSELMTYNETCKFLKISRVTLRRWVKAGKLTPYKVSRNRNYFKRSEVDHLINSSKS